MGIERGMLVGVGEPLMDSIHQDRRRLNAWYVALSGIGAAVGRKRKTQAHSPRPSA